MMIPYVFLERGDNSVSNNYTASSSERASGNNGMSFSSGWAFSYCDKINNRHRKKKSISTKSK